MASRVTVHIVNMRKMLLPRGEAEGNSIFSNVDNMYCHTGEPFDIYFIIPNTNIFNHLQNKQTHVYSIVIVKSKNFLNSDLA